MPLGDRAASAAWKHNVGALLAGGALTFASSTASVAPVQGNVGDLVFGKCTDSSTLPGAECGYAMWALLTNRQPQSR